MLRFRDFSGHETGMCFAFCRLLFDVVVFRVEVEAGAAFKIAS